jgi:3-keto-5-aminohexanoate cleavage enzyme
VKPLIISVGVTGSITTPQQNTNLPITPGQIADSALRAGEAGATVAHIHVREPDSSPSARQELYAEVFDRIRANSDMLICGTTGSGNGRFTPDERMAVLDLAPDLASFDAGSVNFGRRVFCNDPDFLDQLAKAISERRIVPEIECFEIGMVSNTVRMADAWGFPGAGRWWFQFCVGVRGAAPANANTLLAMRSELPPGAEWSAMGVGQHQLRAAHIALVEDGHIRVGLEDNVYYRPGEAAKSNAQFVERIVNMAAEIGRPVATVSDAREMLGLVPTEVDGSRLAPGS